MPAFRRNTPAPGNFNDWRTPQPFVHGHGRDAGAPAQPDDGRPARAGAGPCGHAEFLSRPRRAAAARRDPSSPAKTRRAPRSSSSAMRSWQRRYGGDPDIVGRTLLMNDVRHEVDWRRAAVVRLPRSRRRLLGPDAAAASSWSIRRGAHFLNVVARLKPGVSVEAADARDESRSQSG